MMQLGMLITIIAIREKMAHCARGASVSGQWLAVDYTVHKSAQPLLPLAQEGNLLVEFTASTYSAAGWERDQ